MNAAARCGVWYLLARFMRTLAEEPACGMTDCYDQAQCWGTYTEKYPSRCDSHTDGGGWTILQQRHDPYVNFFRNCTEYKRGFGSGDTFWLGLDKLHRMTAGQQIQFRVEVTYEQRRSRIYAVYDNVTIGDAAHDYALNYAVYNGKGGLQDGFRGSIGRFCCKDHRNWQCKRKARSGRTAWWFRRKRVDKTSDLNAELRGNSMRFGVFWVGVRQEITYTQIKFRPMNAAKPKCDTSCPHGGTCERAADDTFLCRCALGRKGRRCEELDHHVPVVECFCFHGGWCTSAGLCSCRAGYTGLRCQKTSSMTHRKGKPDSRFNSWTTITVLTLFIVFVLLVLTGIFAYRRLSAADSEQEERLLHDYE